MQTQKHTKHTSVDCPEANNTRIRGADGSDQRVVTAARVRGYGRDARVEFCNGRGTDHAADIEFEINMRAEIERAAQKLSFGHKHIAAACARCCLDCTGDGLRVFSLSISAGAEVDNIEALRCDKRAREQYHDRESSPDHRHSLRSDEV